MPPVSAFPPPPRSTHRVLAMPGLRQLSAGLALALAGGLAAVAAALAWLLAWTGLADGATAAALGSLLVGLPLVLALAGSLRALERARSAALAAGAMDPATGVSSRGAFLSLAEREFSRSRRYGIGAALLLVDVDRFRRLIEGHEAQVGDLVLREIAASTQATLRGADALARFGPAQIAVFLAHADPPGALDVAERVRERVEQLEIIVRDQRVRATVSVGVVMMRPAHLSLQAVIDDAETALGAARHAGGNCVRAAPIDPRRLREPGSAGPVDDNRTAGG